MKKNILAENKHGTGGIHQPIRSAIYRTITPHHHKLVGSVSAPYDWTQPYNFVQKLQNALGNPNFILPIKDQGTAGSCGGEAMAYGLEVYNAFKTGVFNEISAKDIYSQVFYTGGGTNFSSLNKLVSNKGACKESLISSYKNGLPPDETFMEQKLQTQATIADALNNVLKGMTPVSKDIDSVAQAVRDNKFVIFLLNGQNGLTPGWLSPKPSQPQPRFPSPFWTHFMTGFEPVIDFAGEKGVKCPQSWGTNVGENGWQIISDSYLKSGYVLDIRTFSPSTVALQISILQQLINLYKQLAQMIKG